MNKTREKGKYSIKERSKINKKIRSIVQILDNFQFVEIGRGCRSSCFYFPLYLIDSICCGNQDKYIEKDGKTRFYVHVYQVQENKWIPLQCPTIGPVPTTQLCSPTFQRPTLHPTLPPFSTHTPNRNWDKGTLVSIHTNIMYPPDTPDIKFMTHFIRFNTHDSVQVLRRKKNEIFRTDSL